MDINVKAVIPILALLFISCSSQKQINSNDFYRNYSIGDIHTLVIVDYLQQQNPKCEDCNFNVNRNLNHKASNCIKLQTEFDKLYRVDDEVNLPIRSYLIKKFAKISVCPESFGCDSLYRFSHLIFDKDENLIWGQVKHPDQSKFLFNYSVLGDIILLSGNHNITEDCY